MEAKYGGVRSMGEWFPGKVAAVSTDGGLTYSIDYADGDKETGVLPKYVRPLVTGAAAAVPKAAEAKQARAEAKPSGEDGQRCGGRQSSGVRVVSSGVGQPSGGGQALDGLRERALMRRVHLGEPVLVLGECCAR